MIVQCQKCGRRFDDEHRWTCCPHDTFAANDGQNNFAHHPNSYRSPLPPRTWRQWPIVRHVRFFYNTYQVERHYGFWRELGMLPLNKHRDEEVLRDIWKGWA